MKATFDGWGRIFLVMTSREFKQLVKAMPKETIFHDQRVEVKCLSLSAFEIGREGYDILAVQADEYKKMMRGKRARK